MAVTLRSLMNGGFRYRSTLRSLSTMVGFAVALPTLRSLKRLAAINWNGKPSIVVFLVCVLCESDYGVCWTSVFDTPIAKMNFARYLLQANSRRFIWLKFNWFTNFAPMLTKKFACIQLPIFFKEYDGHRQCGMTDITNRKAPSWRWIMHPPWNECGASLRGTCKQYSRYEWNRK